MSSVNGAHYELVLFFNFLSGLKSSLPPHLMLNDMSSINIQLDGLLAINVLGDII